MVTQDIAYIYIHINIHMYIHIYIPSYIYNIYIHIHTHMKNDIVDLRSWDSNIEFVKNSYHLYVIVLVWAFSNRWKSNLGKKTRKSVIYEQHSKVHLTITFSKNLLKQTTKAMSVQLSHSPSKTFVISPTPRFGFPDDFFKISPPLFTQFFGNFIWRGSRKKGRKI